MIIRTVLASAAVVVLSSAVGSCRCGGGDGGGTASVDAGTATVLTATASSRVLSCDRITPASVCSEYTGSYLAQNEAVLTATCGKLGGTFAYAECPNSSVLGTCVLATGEARKFFGTGGAPYDPARAKKECESSYKGKWTSFN
jgi:hypothetical protein